jgi:hypothetical protein
VIPSFPDFLPLCEVDPAEYVSWTDTFPPYSDFNLVTLHLCDSRGVTAVSRHRGNLVVLMEDWPGSGEFLSFMGGHAVGPTMLDLLAESTRRGIEPVLHCIPEEAAQCLQSKSPSQLVVQEERDRFDYLLDVDEMVSLQGAKWESKRRSLKRASQNSTRLEVRLLDLDGADVEAMEAVVEAWWRRKGADNGLDLMRDVEALRRCVAIGIALGIEALGVFEHERLLAFELYQIGREGCSLSHFARAVPDRPGLDDLLVHEVAMRLLRLGQRYVNYEEDLGLSGLRKYKSSWRPVRFLKKHEVRAA